MKKRRVRIVAISTAGLMLLAAPAFAFWVFFEVLFFGHDGSQAAFSHTRPSAAKMLKMKVKIKPDADKVGDAEAPYCVEDRQVVFQRRNAKKKVWSTVAKANTNAKGVAVAKVADRTGKYRVKAKGTPASEQKPLECYKAVKVLGVHKH